LIEKFCEMFLKYSKPNTCPEFKAFWGHLNTSSTNNMDLNRFLNWNDTKFYNVLFDIVDNYEDDNLRNYARLCIPPVQALIGIVQTKDKNYYQKDMSKECFGF